MAWGLSAPQDALLNRDPPGIVVGPGLALPSARLPQSSTVDGCQRISRAIHHIWESGSIGQLLDARYKEPMPIDHYAFTSSKPERLSVNQW